MKRIFSLAGALAALVLAITGPARTDDFGPDQPYDRLSGALVTPHVAFARPYVKGKVKVLVIAPTWTQRETVELSQRLDMEFVPLMTESFEGFGHYQGGGERATYLTISPQQFQKVVESRLAPEAKYDVIVIGRMAWNVFPEDVRARILKKVEAGAGLVYVAPAGLSKELDAALADHADTRQTLTEGVPLAVIPALSAAALSTGQVGQGRVVAVSYGEPPLKDGLDKSSLMESLTPAFGSDDALAYDYAFSLLARACLWAARKEPDVRFTGLSQERRVIPRAELARTPIRFTMAGALPAGAQVRCSVRNRWGRQEAAAEKPTASGEFSVVLPPLTAGEKMLDVWVKSGDKVVTWASLPLAISALVRIEKVELAKEVLKAGDPVSASVRLSAPAGALSVAAEVEDAYGRKVAATSVPVRGNAAAFFLPLPHPLTRAFTLRVLLRERGQEVDQTETEFYVNIDGNAPVDDFVFFAWGSGRPNSGHTRTYLAQMFRTGIDTVYNTTSLWDDYAKSREIAQRMARANLKVGLYTTRLFLSSSQHEHTKPVALPDGPAIRNCPLALTPEERAKESGIQHMQDLARAFGPFGPAFYSLGDENGLSSPEEDLCFCDRCRVAFQEYLKGVYPNLAALNAEWGTAYRDWGEVKRITLLDAYRQKRYPQWMDHRLHMDRMFADLHGAYADAITAVDPVARVGIEGPIYPTHSLQGFDLYRMLGHFRYYNPYNHIPEAKVWPFLKGDSLTGIWFGSYQGETREGIMRYTPWHCLFEGMSGAGWWTTGVGGNQGLGGAAAFAPDYTPLPFYQWACQEVSEIKAGIGKALLTSKRTTDPIALYYSNECLHASTIRCKETLWEDSMNDFHTVLRDAGLEYRYVHPEEIRQDALTRFKVLILPYAQAMSDVDAAKIRAFVQAGGTLIADFSPAVMDEHGKMRDRSALTDVFGDFTRLKIHTLGKGKAVCLADYVKGYADKRKGGEGKGILAGMARLLDELAGVRAFAQVTDTDGKPRQDIEVSSFRSGKATYLCLLRSIGAGSTTAAKGPEGSIVTAVGGSEAPEVAVKLPAACEVYDVRAGKHLGNVAQFNTALAPSQAKVFALLPARATAVAVWPNRAAFARGESVTCKVDVAPAPLKECGLVIRVEVIGPDGKPLPYYTRKMVVGTAGASGVVPLCLNEKPGAYRLVATEVATGLQGSAGFVVR